MVTLSIMSMPTPMIYDGYYSPWYGLFDLLSELPIYWILGIISAIFVYHDSTKRKGESGLLWALGAFFLWPIVLILYFLFQHFHTGKTQRAISSRRTYFFFASFVTLLILFWGLADLGRTILGHFWNPYLKSVYIYDSFKRGVSLRFSTVLVTLPLWAFHWFKAIEGPLNQSEKQQKRSYTLTVLGFLSLFVLIFGIGLVYQTLNFLLGVTTTKLSDFATPLSYFTISTVTWLYHFQVLRQTETELKQGKTTKK